MAEVGLGELGGTGRTGRDWEAAKRGKGAGGSWEEREDVGSWGVLEYTGKGKSRGAGAKSKADKSRTSARGQARQAKKGSPKTPGRTPRQPSPGPDGEAPPREPLDVRPILDELLERVLSECALAAAARQRVPFTVSRARDAILFVAEWKFLARDEGDPAFEGDPEPERDGVWSEDEEPQTCPLDSWTRGVVFVDDESSLSSDEIIPGPGRVPRAQPELCDPWLASARLAPGVTVRWGRSERRGPAPPGSGGSGNHEQEDEAVRKAEKELKPILDYPVCQLSEYEQ
ncbi:hypothetical protein DUI87_09701 [Hirundo rustica rustica]|uniref:Uncharacterized protein n=1 Tax=Hirundo rustica rustica TaxID=333673 RepID=A0A3M0KNG5_HIRRU|nr:hypothetical protein DUI87_09701 [Hirundo rustica rustica]